MNRRNGDEVIQPNQLNIHDEISEINPVSRNIDNTRIHDDGATTLGALSAFNNENLASPVRLPAQ